MIAVFAEVILGLWLLCMTGGGLTAVPQTVTILQPPEDWRNESITADGGRVCGSLDIRNAVRFLGALRGCRIIEGYLRIQLFDNTKDEDFKDIVFPELREITEYLLLFRVNGLKSLGDLFPNLSVIRGTTLFVDYALVVYSMPRLEDLGLSSLTSITRGAVRIEDNAELCFLDTVDWNALTVSGSEYIIANKAAEDCGGCDDECASGLCWSKQDCQPVQHTECHDLCLGGCSGPGPTRCNACRTVRLHGECLRSCPVDRLNYLGRHCITDKQCRLMGKKLLGNGSEVQYWPFDNSCVRQCPRGFAEIRIGNGTINGCEACGELCPCFGARVDSIAAAQNLSGCTHINGSIEIEIRGGKHVVQELEDSLGTIQEIYGNLKIVRSFPLVSLNFLKNLRVIKSVKLKNGLIVHNNPNLKELWDLSTKPNGVKIQNGRLFFHDNPKLCVSVIEKMNKMAGLGNFTKHEVSQESNGDKVSCNHPHANNLVANVTIILSKSVVVEWEQVKLVKQSLIRYIIYYIEAPHQNMTTYDERGACGGSDHYWRINYVNAPSDSKVNVHHPLTRLQPFTQYAYYVAMVTTQTYTTRQSQIQYFRTQPDRPSIPVIVKAISNKHHELILQWEAPQHPNGILHNYLISGYVLKDDKGFLDQRNYCQHPMTLAGGQTIDDALLSLKRRRKVLNCCGKEEHFEIRDEYHYNTQCIKHGHESAVSKEEAEAKAEACKDFIHTYLSTHLPKNNDDDVGKFFKKQEKVTYKSEEEIWPPWGYVDPKSATNDTDIKRSDNFVIKVDANTTSMVLRNVTHFAKYSIKVIACRHSQEKDKTRCSFASLATVRSKAMEVADEINFIDVKVKILNETNGNVQIAWSHPKTPNGIIVSYNVEYRRANIQNAKPFVECLTRRQHELGGGAHVIQNLPPGKYWFRIQAISLAGEGPFTEKIEFNFNVREMLSPALFQEMIATAFGTLSVCGCFVLFTIYCRSRFSRKLLVHSQDCTVSSHYVEDHWELPREKVQLEKELGQGSFGMVYEGVLKDGNIPCAIKKVNENSTYREQVEFLNEASAMKSFSDAYHVVKLLGVVSRGHPPLVVMELMALGDLKSYLRATREGNNGPDMRRIFIMAAQIADGMAYLEARKFVHRDLAARNCMLGEDLTVKVGDFGMTRDIYEMDYYRSGDRGMLPVRWMSPESLADGVFSSQSDIWSYGVVLWEMATLAIQPYLGLANEQVLLLVLGGETLEQPKNCPDALYALMDICWKWRPDTRPSFLQLVQRLDTTADLGLQFQLRSFYHTQESSQVDIYPDANTQQLVAHWTNTNPTAESPMESTEPQVVLKLPPPPKKHRAGESQRAEATYSNAQD